MANSENLDLKRLDEPKSTTKFNHQIYYQNNFDKIDAAVGAKPTDLTTTAKTIIPAINELKTNKVDKVTGKGLSTNDFDNTYKQKIDVDIPAQLNEKANQTDVNNALALKANKAQETWIGASLTNGWGGTIEYAKNDMSIVTIVFDLVVGVGTAYTSFFVLPLGYRAKKNTIIRLVNNSTGLGVDFRLYASGTFQNMAALTAGHLLTGTISYYAGV